MSTYRKQFQVRHICLFLHPKLKTAQKLKVQVTPNHNHLSLFIYLGRADGPMLMCSYPT